MSDTISAVINSDNSVDISSGILTRRISLKDYLSVVSGLVDSDDAFTSEAPIRFPSSVHSVTRTSEGHIVNLYFDERVAELEHSNGNTYKVDLPNIMISVHLIKVAGTANTTGQYSMGNIYWYATDRTRVDLPVEWPTGHCTQDHIWALPLPNMYHGARMCTGSNRLPSAIYHDWTILDTLYNDLLLRSKFNNDLSILCVRSEPGIVEWLDTLARSHSGTKYSAFPYDKLTNY